jgi:copper chaperone CopZ
MKKIFLIAFTLCAFAEITIPSQALAAQVVSDVVIEVEMHCHSCVKSIKKTLSTLEGVTAFDVNFKAQTVTDKDLVSIEQIKAAIGA